MLLGVAMYVAFFTSFGDAGDTGNYLLPLVIVGVWNLFVIVAAVIAIVDSVQKVRARDSTQLATDAMVTKLASVPFFLLNFVVLVGSWLVSFGMLLFGGPVLWFVLPVLGVTTYVVMMSTSVYGWAAIIQMRRERSISKSLTVVYTILLVVPVVDTVAGFLLFGRRRPRLARVIAQLAGGVALIASALFGLSWLTDLENGLDSVGVASIIAASVGLGVIVATGIFAFVRRSALRTEGQHAALAALS